MNLFLKSYDYKEFSEARRLINPQIISIDRATVIKTDIDIPLIGQKHGFGEKDIETIFLMSRIEGIPISIHSNFSIEVFVLIPKSSEISIISSLEDLNNIAWAFIYRN